VARKASTSDPGTAEWLISPMDNTTVLFWNVRGLNSAARRDSVQTALGDDKANVGG
jgi:hypothetical protein